MAKKRPTAPQDELPLNVEDDRRRKASGPVTCLGMTFKDDDERRAHFTELLREKLSDPAFRAIEGFPIGEDEDILALSDPPYYTACPNPWIGDFIREWEAQKPAKPAGYKYHREPFAADVSEGKNDPIYNAHSYHTKVPHKAVMRFILHYTEPGDIVFDGFCGTGMTGVAAQMCGNKAEVESLGYRVQPDGTILQEEETEEGKKVWVPFSKLGARRAVLNDLSPAATFIAYNYNTPVDVEEFEREARRILAEVEEECGWMYTTLVPPADPEDPKWKQKVEELADRVRKTGSAEDIRHTILQFEAKGLVFGRVNFNVWSDIFSCPECAGKLVFWDIAVDQASGSVMDSFSCPHCSAQLAKRALDRVWDTQVDATTRETVRAYSQAASLINYSIGKKRLHKRPDLFDQALLLAINRLTSREWFPTNRLIDGKETRRNDVLGLSNVNHFYFRRNLLVMAIMRHRLLGEKSGRPPMGMWFTSTHVWGTKFNRLLLSNFFKKKGGVIGQTLQGTFYISSISVETNLIERFSLRVTSVPYTSPTLGSVVATQSSSHLKIPSGSVDYIFLDPPFGANINYSELNSLWEAWLKVQTRFQDEAIENSAHGKDLGEYRRLITLCFVEAYRTLRPGGWMTVEFSNTQASVWNGIQTALTDAGFVVANVSLLEKDHKGFRAVTTPTAVKQDLVISAYKPNGGLEERFKQEAGTTVGAWDFIQTHLRQLPVFVTKKGRVETIAERTVNILYDRLVAFHVVRSAPVPLSAGEFIQEMAERYPERDGMYFLPEQVAEYDKKRIRAEKVEQLELFVKDEATAIQWLRQELRNQPQTASDLTPKFMKEISHWEKFEKGLELKDLLFDNFIKYDGKGEVPSQIHRYLSTNWHELRNLPKDDPKLQAKAKDRWYVPDPNKEADLEKVRLPKLLREFWSYLPEGYKPTASIEESPQMEFLPKEKKKRPTGKKLKIVRLEAVRTGFKHCWAQKDYETIIVVGDRLPGKVLEEDEKLLRWYQMAKTRSGDED